MSKEEKLKACFVIAPIGTDGSAERLRSDQVLKHIIAPTAQECGYEAIRADHISEPGIITSQVIQHIVDDPLVIADLTGRNPNVFYELALRHAIKKPIVQIINATESIPFDVAASRTVHVDHRDLDSAARAREEIKKQIRHAEKNPADVDTPISVAIELQSLRKSDNPLEKSYAEILAMLTDMRAGMSDMRDNALEKSYAEILAMLTDMRAGMSDMRDNARDRFIFAPILEDLMMSVDRLNRALEFEDGKLPTPELVELLRSSVRRLEAPLEHLCMESGLPPEIFMRKLRIRRVKG